MNGVTLAILAFNQARTIEDAIRSAFEQDYGDLEIILSDDCSDDRTYEVMARLASRYEGPHRVVVNRNQSNVGLVEHLNRILEMASHELIVLNAGDDISMPHRVSTMSRRFYVTSSRPLLIHSHAIPFAGNTIFPVMVHPTQRGLRKIARPARQVTFYVGPTAAISAEMYRIYGPLNSDGRAEDTSLGFRAAILGRLDCVEEPLVMYRLGQGLTSSTNRFTYASFNAIIEEKKEVARVHASTFTQRSKDLKVVREVIGDPEFRVLSEGTRRQLLRATRREEAYLRLARILAEPKSSSNVWWGREAIRDLGMLLKLFIIWGRRALLFVFSRKPSRSCT